MQFEICALPGGGKLELYLRSPDPAMPNALRRPLVLVVPGGGYEHVSAREAGLLYTSDAADDEDRVELG